jgi:beta-lactamase regulating signal transducer with metallopeptidase domain
MMAAFSLALLRFGAACAGSIVCAFVLAVLLRRAATRWPALAAHRSVWLLAQGAIVIVFALALAPLPRSALAPTVALPMALPQPLPMSMPLSLSLPQPLPMSMPLSLSLPQPQPLPPSSGAPTLALNTMAFNSTKVAHAASVAVLASNAGPATQAVVVPPASTSDALRLVQRPLAWLPAIWLGVYLAGVVGHALIRLRAQRRWQRLLLRHARIVPDAELRAWPAITRQQRERIAQCRLTVRATDLSISPMLLGVWRPCLLLPAHLSTLDVDQQHLIVEHELTHHRRADPLWLMLSGALRLAFWFNRPFRHLNNGLHEAVELGCDDAVLAGRAADERQGYAAALVAQLRLHLRWQTHAGVSAAFGSVGVVARVKRMRAPCPPRLSARSRALIGAAALGFATLGGALQPAFSSNTVMPKPQAPLMEAQLMEARPAPLMNAEQTLHATDAWRYPLEQVRVTTLYGVRCSLAPKGNHGVDFVAPRGTPVHAVAAGTVTEAAFNPSWGHYVRVDHGGSISSLLIHLDSVAVTIGQHVGAGDLLGASGASGRVTGAHLHLEYWRDGRRLDPQMMLADLSDHATAHALAHRRAQGNRPPADL